MINNDIEIIQPGLELEKLIKDTNLHDAVTDTAQLITDIPIIGTLVKSMKFASNLHEHIFSIKIQKFLYELKCIPTDQRQKKINELNNSTKLQYSVGLVILDQLNRIDINYKPQILGKLFAAFCNEKIDLETYLRLAHIVEQTFFIDLYKFQKYSLDGIYQSTEYNSLDGGELMSTDYAKMFQNEMEEFSNLSANNVSYPELTELGKKFLSHGF